MGQFDQTSHRDRIQEDIETGSMTTFEKMNFEMDNVEDKSHELDPEIMDQLKTPYNDEFFIYFESGLKSAIDQVRLQIQFDKTRKIRSMSTVDN